MEEYRYWRACFARGLIGSQSGFWWHKAMTSHKIGLFKKGGQIGAVGKILAVLLLLGMVADLPDSVQGAAVDHVSTLLEFRNIYCDLPDWVNTSNPCVGNWTGITCSAVAGDLEITEINLRNRSCYGTIPRSLQNIRTLTSLRLEYNNFTDNFPGFLHMLPELRYLDLTNNTISGSLPREIANFTSLEILNVSNNRLNGVLPEEFVMLKKLRNIRLAGNTLVSGGVLGGLPANLHTMESLLEFNVSRNQFGGELTAKIGLLPKIEILDISRNYFRGFLPEEIGNLTTLKYLDLNTNGFNGPLPHSIGKLIQLETLGIRANGFGEDIPKELANLKNLTRLFLRYNQFGGLIPSELGDLTGLVELFLNDNKLTGGIPETFEHLTNLKSFHVGGNKLSGRIPSFLGKFKDLKLLNLSNNSFSGRIPWTLTDITYPKGELKTILLYWNDLSGEVPEGFQNINMSGDGNFTITDNPRLCGNGTMYGVSVYKAGLKPCVPEHVSTVMIVVIVLSALVVIFCSVAIVLLYRRKQQLARAKWEAMVCQQDGQEHDEENAPSEVPTFKPCGVNYSVAEIEKATSNFAILLGRGGYGPVYKAVLPDGVEAAVKIQQKHTKQGDQEFITENELLGRLHHKKLVNLLGYCTNDVVRMLVYEFKSNGSLFSHLHGEKAHPEKITWPMRLKIALDVAEGLQYLHHGADPPVIHRDIKSGNILLDVHFNAYIADFGISKEGPTDLGNNMTVGVTSVVKGTPGYLDPEYFYSRKLTRKSDVYSFGVLLMELLTGTNPCTSGVSLSEIARSLDQSMKIADLIDPSLCGDYNGHEAWTMAQVAAKCVHRDVDKRPRMKAVLAMLENQIPVPIGDTNTEEFTGECSAVKLLPGQCGSDANGRSFGSSSPRNLKTDIKFATASEGTDEEKVITIVEESLTNFYPR